jgi:succinate dehydrogenase/fumarate reductase flavoprotein subunit
LPFSIVHDFDYPGHSAIGRSAQRLTGSAGHASAGRSHRSADACASRRAPECAAAGTGTKLCRDRRGKAHRRSRSRFGRSFIGAAPLAPPFEAVKVTGALFHTQGGLAVDRAARVLDTNGKPLPNIFAAGGAAAGVSGPRANGYLSGNGLLTATVLGRVAGQTAAALVKQRLQIMPDCR